MAQGQKVEWWVFYNWNSAVTPTKLWVVYDETQLGAFEERADVNQFLAIEKKKKNESLTRG